MEANWQPIETAPKDALVLLYEDEVIRVAFWSETLQKWEQPAVPVWRNEWGDRLSSSDLQHGYGLKGGLELSDCLYEPTHWMPLPVAPKSLDLPHGLEY